MKKIVALDIYPFDAKDFEFLAAFGTYELFEHTAPKDLYARIKGAEILLTNKTKLSEQDLEAAQHLEYIGVTATGYNVVDVAAAQRREIPVTNIPAYGTASVAQHTFALLLALTNHVGAFSDSVRQGAWAKSKRFCLVDPPVLGLNGKTLGIIGFGAIGQAVANIAKAYGMDVQAYSRSPWKNPDVRYCTREALFQTSDVITLHCPATPETDQIINTQTLAMMKPSAFLLNTSRGNLIHENALYQALQANKIAGAGLDVLAEEPPPLEHDLTQLPNCLITPHVAWSSTDARARILQVTQENLAGFLTGRRQNVVNG